MDKEKVIITNDGKILQPDDVQSGSNILAQVNPEEVDDAVRYFQKKYSELEGYVNASLHILDTNPDSDENREMLETLKNEIIFARVIGDTEALIEKINSVHEGNESKSGPKPSSDTDDKSDSESTSGSESEVKSETESMSEPESNIKIEVESGSETETDLKSDSKPASEPEPVVKSDMEPKSDVKQKAPEMDVGKDDENAEMWKELRALVDRATELSKEADWQYVQNELDNIRFKWNELISDEKSLTTHDTYVVLLKMREDAENVFSDRKAAYQEKRRERKRENLDRRAKILDQIQNVIDKKRWKSIKEVNNLIHRWEEIKDLPVDNLVNDQDKKFQQLVDEFNEQKVAYLVRKAEKEEENLIGKLAIIDKLKQLVASIGPETEKWDQLETEVEELSRQWRKIGHVPMEQSNSVWDQFKAVRDEYFDKKFEFNKAFQKVTSKNIQRKTRLCEKAEALLNDQDLALAVREINLLHKRWKKIGPIPKEKNEELWERFNAATKKFNEIKTENQDTIKQQETENLEKKVELCEKAESLKESTSWDETSREMDALMKTWKEIGPAPRRKAGKLWRRFKNALDHFYNNRRDHFRDIRSEQKQNYDSKREIITELEKLVDHEDPSEAANLAKDLQEKYRKIGFVPIKKKSKITADYKNVCDRIFQRARNEGKSVGSEDPGKAKGAGDKAIRSEFFKLKKECDKLNEEILRYQDTKTFINPGGQGSDLIEEIQQKIDKALEILEAKQEKLEELRREMEG